jgi:hypothetical protein
LLYFVGGTSWRKVRRDTWSLYKKISSKFQIVQNESGLNTISSIVSNKAWGSGTLTSENVSFRWDVEREGWLFKGEQAPWFPRVDTPTGGKSPTFLEKFAIWKSDRQP